MWLKDEAVPRPSDLAMIWITLERSSDVLKGPMELFRQMANLPARKVSPFGKRMLPTVWEYMHRPAFSELSSKLAKLSAKDQEELLDGLYPE